MYAVFKTGGKQYRAAEGEWLKIEKLDAEVGSSIEFDEVLMVANGDDIKVGAPMLEGGKVTAEVLEQGRHKKIDVVKFRRRKHSKSRIGHRQYFTEVKITGISA